MNRQMGVHQMMDIFRGGRIGGFDPNSGQISGFGRICRMGFASPWMWLLCIAVMALVVVGIVFLVRAIIKSSRKAKMTGTAQAPGEGNQTIPTVSNYASQALQILNERFARGEIDLEEYGSRKEALLKQ
jgi:uncharacterized membrane protein